MASLLHCAFLDISRFFLHRYRLVPGDTCCDGSADVRRYLDTHQICKNVSWYEYGMNYKYEAKNDKKSKVSLRRHECNTIVKHHLKYNTAVFFSVSA